MTKKKRRAFSAEFKAEAVRLCQIGDRTIAKVAQDLELKDSVLRTWVKAAQPNPSNAAAMPATALSKAEREELDRLRRENKRLLMEREILKKATAFFAKESE